MRIRKISFILALLTCITKAGILANVPTIAPTVVFTDADGNESTERNFSGSAPITAKFTLNPADAEGWIAHYEWRFYKDGNSSEPYMIRYEENTEYTFTQSGANYIECYTTFIQGTDTVKYEADYWQNNRFTVSVYESKLEFPNAFSPNGDGINDVYRAKTGYQSIIDFKAVIINRWGQKLYEWKDLAGGWDGTYKGKDVKSGTYYCIIKARGADGRVFNIRKDVNLMRNYIDTDK